MAKDVKVGTVRVQGEQLDCYANTDGKWMICRPPEEGEAEEAIWGRILGSGSSIDAAKRTARKKLKETEVEVAVPFKYDRRIGYSKETEIVEGTGLRLKAGDSRTVLVSLAGKKDTLGGGYGDADVWKAETPDEVIEESQRLQERANQIATQRREIEEEWEFDLIRAVREAVQEEAAIQADDEEEPDEIAPAEG